MAEHYTKSPLVEAVFEFAPIDSQFEENTVAQVDARLETAYTGKRDAIQAFPVLAFRIEKGQMSPGRLPEPVVRYRRWKADESRLIQFSRDLCAFNVLPPYSHLNDYLSDMEEFFGVYSQEARPNGTRFLGQRYINRIVLPSRDNHAAEFFSVYPGSQFAKSLPHPPFMLSLQTATLPGERQGNVTVNLVFRGFEGQRPIYVLEIYARTPDFPAMVFEWSVVRDWHTVAHEAVQSAFTACLTDEGMRFLGYEHKD